jgi:hypothetical protein
VSGFGTSDIRRLLVVISSVEPLPLFEAVPGKTNRKGEGAALADGHGGTLVTEALQRDQPPQLTHPHA